MPRALGLPAPVPSVSQRDVWMVSTTTESGLDGDSHDLGITPITIPSRHFGVAVVCWCGHFMGWHESMI